MQIVLALLALAAGMIGLMLVMLLVGELLGIRSQDFDQHGSEYPPNGESLAFTRNGDANVSQ